MEWIKSTVKKITLELIYNIVDERTSAILEKQEKDKQELLGHIFRLEEKQEKDKQELFTLIISVRDELLSQIHRIEEKEERHYEELKAEIRHLNQRFDTLMNML
ncbi:MAG: hypothetical protein ACK42C_03255, partial [Aquificaceae bacterium]